MLPRAQADPLSPNSTVKLGGDLVGSSPESFYPVEVTLDAVDCHLEQD
jgi:hypothetical protein